MKINRFIIILALFLSIGIIPLNSYGEGSIKINYDSVNEIKTSVNGNVVSDINTFSWKIYKRLSNDGGDVLFFSPFSILTALSMVYTGASGNTSKEMKKALNINSKRNIFLNNLSKILKKMDKISSCKLKIANSLWVEKNLDVDKEFLKHMKNIFFSSMFFVDFQREFEKVRSEINKWVSNKTENRINNLIGRGVLTSLTRLVIVNAIYFKGSWNSKFKKSNTKKLPFYNVDNTISKIDIMYQKNKFKFLEMENYKVLQLPYKNNELSMNIILPDKNIGIDEIEKSMDFNEIMRRIDDSRIVNVKVYLPKFKVTTKFILNNIMKKMGMIDAFTNNANFSKIDKKNGIKISLIIHKAFINVNEEGTEAAAATAVVMRVKSMHIMNLTPVFRVDHPFTFFIVDNRDKEILFVGRISKLK